MRTLVMDGVGPRRPLDLRQRPIEMVTPKVTDSAVFSKPLGRAAITIDGIRRPVVPAGDWTKPVALATSQQQLQETWINSAVARRYRWAGVVSLALIVPALALSSGHLVGLAQPRSKSTNTNAASATLPAKTAPPIASVQAAAVATPAPQNDAALQQLLHEFTTTQTTPFGIVIKDLKTGITTTSSPDQVFTSASLYKLFVAQTIYKRIDTGRISFSDRVGGTGRNVADCLRVMINISDNSCGRALGSMIGWGSTDGDLNNLGFKHTSLAATQRTSASDVALLLERLYQGTLLSPSSTQQFVELLKDQRVNNRLPVGLPAGTTIAHKTGDLDGFVHDAGIVYGPKTDYLIVVTSGPWRTPAEAPTTFADLSSKIFAHFNQ